MRRSTLISLLSRHLLQSDGSDTNIDETATERHDGDVLIISFCLLLIGVFIGYCYESTSTFQKIERYFPQASANLILGFLVGLILSLTGTLEDAFSFSPEFFFIYLLPPIIFSSGYNLSKDFFFHNFGSIMAFAFVGTTLSAFFIGAFLTAFGSLGVIEPLSFTKNMMLGSLISAVDPVAVILVLKSLAVDEQLKVLLFGEAVLNDAASVVINRVFVSIDGGGKTTSQALAPAIPQIAGIAIASMLIGTAIALFVALLHKFSRMNLKKSFEIELAAFLLGAFLPYGIAEALGLSGICSVLFAGIMTDYYTYHHLSIKSQATTRHVVSTFAYISELFVFIYLGMSFFLEQGHQFKGGYVVMTLVLCFCARAISVFPLAFLLNMGRKHKLPMKHQIVLWYSGLRGPVAYALAVATPEDGSSNASNIIITTTVFIVAFTTLMLGGLAYPFLKFLRPPIMDSTKNTKTDTYDISNHWFNRLDRRFLRPVFGPKQRRNNNLNRPIIKEQKSDDPQLELMRNQNESTKNKQTAPFDMEYVNVDTNATPEEETQENGNKIHLNITQNLPADYSMPRTQPPSFIDNPREERDDDQSNTAVDHISLQKSVTPPPNENDL